MTTLFNRVLGLLSAACVHCQVAHAPIPTQSAESRSRMLDVEVMERDGEGPDRNHERPVEFRSEVDCPHAEGGARAQRHYEGVAPNARFSLTLPDECDEVLLRLQINPSRQRCVASDSSLRLPPCRDRCIVFESIQCESTRYLALIEGLSFIECDEVDSTSVPIGEDAFLVSGCGRSVDLHCVDPPYARYACEPIALPSQ